MTTTFQKLDPMDYIFNKGASSYHIEVFDNGIRYELLLVHTSSGKTVDSHSLHNCLMCPEFVDPCFYNHKVIKGKFDRSDWIDNACPYVLKTIEDRINANNQQSLIDFLKEHNEREERLREFEMKRAFDSAPSY